MTVEVEDLSKILSSDPDKCTGCGLCEMICAYQHYNTVNSAKSAIRIVKLFPVQDRNIPTFCVQCDIAPCETSCPNKAIIRTGVYLEIKESLCINCKTCIEACPFGVMLYHRDVPTPIKCDLCSGDPQCVKYCPADCLSFGDLDEQIWPKEILAFRLIGKEL